MTTRTPRAHAATEPMSRVALLLVLTAGLLLAGLVGAGPAAAIDDPRRPDARVTHGPSCRPGGVVVEVVAGTVPYAVTLATTRAPDGEDAALLEPGETAVLRTGDVAWGETIDGYLEYAALDDSGGSHVDGLDGYTFTRPAEEDCAAIIAPVAPATVPLTPPPPGSAHPEPPGEGKRAGADGVQPAGSPPGAPARSFGNGGRPAEVVAVEPAALTHEASLAPLFVALVALVAALAGLLAVAGRRGSPKPPSGEE